MKKLSLAGLKEKRNWVRKETLRLHKISPETRIASSLSDVEILVVLYYGGIFRYHCAGRKASDRLIVSKAHGAVSLYPILADLGFFDKEELSRIGKPGALLGVIPDPTVPGILTNNGSLGHGLGVASGIALAFKRKKISRNVFVICGDGELNEGAVWEAVMFSSFHKLNNLVLIIDNNRKSMLGPQKDILGLEPYEKKFGAFGWTAVQVDGHDIRQIQCGLRGLISRKSSSPKVLIANTCKGKGVFQLEKDPLCHIKCLNGEEIDNIIACE